MLYNRCFCFLPNDAFLAEKNWIGNIFLVYRSLNYPLLSNFQFQTICRSQRSAHASLQRLNSTAGVLAQDLSQQVLEVRLLIFLTCLPNFQYLQWNPIAVSKKSLGLGLLTTRFLFCTVSVWTVFLTLWCVWLMHSRFHFCLCRLWSYYCSFFYSNVNLWLTIDLQTINKTIDGQTIVLYFIIPLTL